METEGKSYSNTTDRMHTGRGVKNPLRTQKGNLIWLERMMGGVVGLRALIMGNINKARTKKKDSVDS